MKRFIIATILGLVFGFVCYGFASSGNEPLPLALALSIILSRMLIGFAIGVNRFKMKHWSIRGLVFGFVFSLPGGFSAMSGPENPEFSHQLMLISTIAMGMIYGFFTELITTVVFKTGINK